MKDSSAATGSGKDNLVVEIIERLEDHGLDRDSYHLYDFIDVDALKQFVENTDAEFTVEFTIEANRVRVTRQEVTVTRNNERG